MFLVLASIKLSIIPDFFTLRKYINIILLVLHSGCSLQFESFNLYCKLFKKFLFAVGNRIRFAIERQANTLIY